MKVTFLYGRSGSGKTYTIAKRLRHSAADGVRSFLLVPEQQSHTAERRMLSLLPPRAQLTVEALSFTRLANRVFRQVGGLSYHYATGGVQALLMWRRLCELSPLLEEYGEQAQKNPALTEVMLSAVGELKGCSVSPARLERVADKLPQGSTLRKRLRDISLIYAAYQNELHERYDDASDDLARLCEVLRDHAFFAGSHVYIDDFTSFTAQEIDILRYIFRQAEQVTVALGCDGRGDTSLHLATLSDTATRLWQLASDCGCEIEEIRLRGNKRAQSPELAVLEAGLWQLEKDRVEIEVPTDVRGQVRLIHCADPYEEAEAAAALIESAVRGGARYRDFVVICRDAVQYEGILDAALEKVGIPAFYAQKTDLSSLPLIKLILTAMRIVTHNWRQGDVITHLKTGLCPFASEDIDAFEGYVTTWRLRGNDFLRESWRMNPDGYVAGDRMSPRATAVLEAANRVRTALVPPLLTLQKELEAAQEVPAMCRALYRYLETVDVKEQLRRSAARDFARGESGKVRAQESLRLYGTVLDVLDQMATAMPETELTGEEFATALKLMFDRTQLASIPDTVDQVLVGSASMLRTDEPACAILLGLCEGSFPRAVQDDGFFSDADKKVLEELGVKLSAGSDLRSSDELYFVYRAITAPSQRLILITSDADCDGKLRQPSMAFSRAVKLLPHIKEEVWSRLPAKERLWHRETVLEALPDMEDARLRETVAAVLRKDAGYARRLDSLNTPVSDPECEISPEVARIVFPPKLSLTQTRLDQYVLCHFRYYCSYVLGLKEEQPAQFRVTDIGTLIHTILEAFFRGATEGRERGQNFAEELTDGACEVMVDEILGAYLREICPEGQAPSNRLQHLFLRLRRLALLLIENLREEFRHSAFVPTYFELNIREGNRGDLPAPMEIHLDNGETVSMRGIIDRVDVFRKDGNIYLRVVDYKTGSKEFSLDDVQHGLNVQLLLYLFTLLKNSPDAFKKKLELGESGKLLPAGVLYLSANVPPIAIDDDLTAEEIKALAQQRLARHGLLLNEPEVLYAMNDDLEPAFLGNVRKTRAKSPDDIGLSGASLIDAETFAQIGEDLEQTIRAIATSMKKGQAQAKPYTGNAHDPCSVCGMRSICRSARSAMGRRF